MDGIEDLICDVEGDCDLYAYAAAAALRELAKNWTAATKDGMKIGDLVTDVPRVIERLNDFARRMEIYAAQD